MKTINIARLKAELSRVLRDVQAGGEVTVLDRKRPVARIVPVQVAADEDVWERLAREGKCRLGTQDFKSLKISKLSRPIDIDEILAWTRSDRSL